jgi:hypothetical protein
MVDLPAGQLARALEAGDFEAAELFATEFADRAALTGNAAVLRQALDTLNDCLHLMRVLRAHLATQVRANGPAVEYQPAVPEKPRWQFEG